MGIGRRRITMSKKIETAPRPYTELALGTQYPGIRGFHDFWTWKIRQLGGIIRSHRVVLYRLAKEYEEQDATKMPCNASDKNKPDNLLISTAGMGQDAKIG
jgi:hypothetical protein